MIRRKHSNSEKGQMSLVIAMMISTFLFLMAFSVGVGILVHAKINLQNATDLAAYAGAAVQARQLTHISYLNYEMRRQFKKYLFRYLVLGNYAQPGFPAGAGAGPNPRQWRTGRPPNTIDYRVPVTCIIFSGTDNYCQTAALQSVVGNYTPNPFVPISQTLFDNLQMVEKIRKDNCVKIGKQNEYTQKLWLFNADPDLSQLTQRLNASDPAIRSLVANVSSISRGLGLIPREILLSLRIQTLASYLNEGPIQGLSSGSVDALKRGGSNSDPSSYERSVQSFMTAYYNLGPNTFDPSSLRINELMPIGQPLAKLDPINISDGFDAYFSTMESDGTPNGACKQQVTPLFVTNALTLGYSKDPKYLTYYAVAAEAEANLLFLGRIKLKAMAAAQPFGSRIGPVLKPGQDIFAEGLMPDVTLFTGSSGGAAGNAFIAAQQARKRIPNLPVGETDDSTAGGGWFKNEVLGYMRAQMPTGTAIDAAGVKRALDFAMAPNPWERGRYNIPSHFPDAFAVQFDATDTVAFWAPILPPKEEGDLSNQLRSRVSGLFAAAGGSATSGGPDPFLDALLPQLESYINSELRNGRGEDGEGFKIARLKDPLRTRDPNGQVVEIADPAGKFLMSTSKDFKDSYYPDHLNPPSKAAGRSGYSVRLVSFSHLLNPQRTSSLDPGGETWINFPAGDPDLPSVSH